MNEATHNSTEETRRIGLSRIYAGLALGVGYVTAGITLIAKEPFGFDAPYMTLAYKTNEVTLTLRDVYGPACIGFGAGLFAATALSLKNQAPQQTTPSQQGIYHD